MAHSRPINADSLSIIPLLETCRDFPVLMTEGWAVSQLLKYQTNWTVRLRLGLTSNGLLDEDTLRRETQLRSVIPENVRQLRPSKRPEFPRPISTGYYMDEYHVSDSAYNRDVCSEWKVQVKKSKQTVERCLRTLQFFGNMLEATHYRHLCQVPDSRFGMTEYIHLINRGYRCREDLDVAGLTDLRERVLRVILAGAPRITGEMKKGLLVKASEFSDARMQPILQVVFQVLSRKNRFDFWAKRAAYNRAVTRSEIFCYVEGRGRPVSGSLINARWPVAPLLAEGEQTYICPFCGDTLLRADAEHGNWEIHVSRDLAPYTCFVSGCKYDPFRRRDELQTHMEVEHGCEEYWKCFPCERLNKYREYRTKDRLLKHLYRAHPTFDCSRETGRPPVKLTRPAGIRECPLCFLKRDDATDPEQLLDHIERHLRDVALLALPGVEISAGGDDDYDMALDGEDSW
ncbi:hypothetical protein BO94DRAFT_590809 [Aspergillus sclerotioniger CBS 115572]|uniref:C2H2-type domain-containing protein n=1 Tax=Aspergillus sclerotioniger CBS 115572 TaxID=1450535 RepID=A0A317V4J1_9EURO|nr:hypothetical protein BO94DRAFT_590809 [Aspergillus sclerotioniger CBS 115572]PWY67998.1 hypothetical protein BO94DRAFT_590809 [Aspergillus sclerotioniger CBS 115572]